MLKGSLASALEAKTVKMKGDPAWMEFIRMLRNAGRMTVSADVMSKVDSIKWRGETYEALSKEILAAVRLPFEYCWIEWAPASAFDHGKHCEKMGYLIHKEHDGLYFHMAMEMNDGVALSPVFGVAGPESMSSGWNSTKPPKHLTETQVDMLEEVTLRSIGLIGRVLVLLTAKNAPLVFGEMDNYERLNKQRKKLNRPPLLGTMPVRWDLTRLVRRAGRDLSPSEESDAISHMCRGHVKIRKSGSFWWSPHWRNLRGELPPSGGRDHTVIDSGC